MTMSTWELVKGCPVRRRGQGSLRLPDVEARKVGWKCHLEKYKTIIWYNQRQLSVMMH